MDQASIESAVNMVWSHMDSFHKEYLQIVEDMKAEAQDAVEEFKEMVAQIPNAKSRPLIHKTPKVSRMRIATIPEDETVDESTVKRELPMNEDDDMEEEVLSTRIRRAASVKASKSIKKQQSMSLNAKLRRPSALEEVTEIMPVQPNRTKRQKTRSGSDDDSKRPAKQSKMDNAQPQRKIKPVIKIEPMSESSPEKTTSPENIEPVKLPRKLRSSSSLKLINKPATPLTIINDTADADVTLTEQSMYEDAIGKSIPMNSTMNPNTTVTIDRKILNVTVVLEKMNETRTISKGSMSTRSTNSNHNKQSLTTLPEQPLNEKIESDTHDKNATRIIQKDLFVMPKPNSIDDLITDDESSPDRAKEMMKKQEKLPVKKRKRIRENTIDDSDEDVIMGSPFQTNLRQPSTVKRPNNLKYKSAALFSPYAKESVKKRVEAFEQAKQVDVTADIESSGRVTRTKTRAMAANANEQVKTPKLITSLARKSLAKAKKISLAKQKREYEEEKENTNKLKNDKLLNKQQLRTTPIGKSRLQMPMSVSRIPHTPIGTQLVATSKALTASRVANIASSTESLSTMKPISKSNSTDSLADKKNKYTSINEEDARRKKEEALKAQTEEKRRKREEKELKNKLAREAREKLELEKRLKQEKEREEKARNALITQEKLREEAEKKRLLQLQRAQEKEERRRQEELLKQQRLQEQEETERLLAEQKRREQEAERRRMAETRAQQLAAAEAARLKQQYQAKAKMLQQQKIQQAQGAPTSYKIDSDPDDDESDNESHPKHEIPHWARSEIRKTQLELQQYIPMNCALKFFGAKKCTPDLSEIFVGIKKERLKRTSSAIWKTPPRFSMMEDD